ncbi:GCG_CRPN prefix-to-repeats domain-containing protein [Methylorubrum subtropicum]|uniref:GCG_CRPN prefix-to-repeats domain-containing protein n=1 Tax=Methylorubrum subtropicum TaxID=3138812 RepID=UPI00399CBC73
MIYKLILPIALVSGMLLTAPTAEARDGCGPGFHRDYYGGCRPNWRPYADRPFVYCPGYRRFGDHRWGGDRWHDRYHYSGHRDFAWHAGRHRGSGFRHGGWHRRF